MSADSTTLGLHLSLDARTDDGQDSMIGDQDSMVSPLMISHNEGDHSQRVAISQRARWYLGELMSFLPRRMPLPTRDCGVGGLGMETVMVVKRQSKMGVMEESPIEHVSKYSIPYFLASDVASALATVFLEVPQRSTLFPTSIRIGGLAFSFIWIHFSTFQKLCRLVTSNMQMAAVHPSEQRKVYSALRMRLGISQQLMRQTVSSSVKATDLIVISSECSEYCVLPKDWLIAAQSGPYSRGRMSCPPPCRPGSPP